MCTAGAHDAAKKRAAEGNMAMKAAAMERVVVVAAMDMVAVGAAVQSVVTVAESVVEAAESVAATNMVTSALEGARIDTASVAADAVTHAARASLGGQAAVDGPLRHGGGGERMTRHKGMRCRCCRWAV